MCRNFGDRIREIHSQDYRDWWKLVGRHPISLKMIRIPSINADKRAVHMMILDSKGQQYYILS